MAKIRVNDTLFNGVQHARLSAAQCARLHSASLEILARTGVRLYHQEAVDILQRAGASVSDGTLVRIPASMVEKALTTVPKRITLYDRFGKPTMFLEDYRCYYGPGSDCLYIVDHRTGQRRKAVLQDVIEGIKLCDALRHVDFVMSMFLPSDVDPGVSDRSQMEVMLNHTSKPIIFVTNDLAGCIDAVAMAETVVGGAEALRTRPFVACYVNVTTPLRHNAEALGKLLYLAERGLPVLYIPVITAGATGPMTLAGSMATLNAGVLAGLVLSQLKREGTPVIVPASGLVALDMRTMVNPYCSPDGKGLTHAMAHYYQLPMFGLGGASESKLVDQQATAEAALTLMMETLAGGHLIHDMGYLESGLSGSLAQLVICNEIVSWLEHYVAPVEISDETLALDLIDAIGPEGNFIQSEHTLAHFREHWYPQLFERGNLQQWQQMGAKSLGERAAEMVDTILSQHRPTPLPEDIQHTIGVIVQRAAAQPPGGAEK